MVAMAPSQPNSSPPKVSRHPSSQPVPWRGEWGQRWLIRRGSMFGPYAAYIVTPRSLTAPQGLFRKDGTMPRVTHVAIIGGGPGGYEAALVAAQLEAEVTVVDTDGVGGSAVLTDC